MDEGGGGGGGGDLLLHLDQPITQRIEEICLEGKKKEAPQILPQPMKFFFMVMES